MVKEEQQRILYRDALTAETSSVRHGKRDPIALFSQREDTGGKLMGKYHLLGSTEGPRLEWQGHLSAHPSLWDAALPLWDKAFWKNTKNAAWKVVQSPEQPG